MATVAHTCHTSRHRAVTRAVVVGRRRGGLLGSWEPMRQTGLGESSGDHILQAQAREVRMETQPTRLVEVDGSLIGTTPISISIHPPALRVIVPKT
jgi:diacylglycerol kinase family enzyme